MHEKYDYPVSDLHHYLDAKGAIAPEDVPARKRRGR